MAIATLMVIVHVVSVVPDVVGAGPEYQDEETEEAGEADLGFGPLSPHLRQHRFPAVWADHSLR